MDLTADNVPANSSAPEPERTSKQRESFRFSGDGSEYFRIWIVNLSLTILTLGIYSAWAKVRKNRYIYGNLSLAGSHFDYTAKPLVILRGRLFAIALLLAYLLLSTVAPLFSTGFALILFAGTPWLLVRSRMFNMRYTTYRNIRFSFNRAYSHAFGAVFGGTLLTVFTLGIGAPYAHYMRNQMVVDNTNFGQLHFLLGRISGKFYRGYMLAGLLMVALLFAGFSLWGIAQTFTVDPLVEEGPFSKLAVLVPVVSVAIFYYVIIQFVRAYVLKATTNATTISDQELSVKHRLGCDWSLNGMLGIYLTNLFAIALSLGLLIPWAQMRILRYQLNHTWLEIDGDLDRIVAGQDQYVSSLGEEIGDVFDVEVGL